MKKKIQIIEEYTKKIKELLFFCPDYAFEIFEKIIDNSSILDITLTCANQKSRTSIGHLLFTSLKIAIEFYKFDLDEAKFENLNQLVTTYIIIFFN